jgi:class 3 adenylate cyclase
VAGVIGERKFSYDLWGDTVNVAARMESSGIPGCIQVTDETHRLLGDRYPFERREGVEVKGKGEMTTWTLDPSTLR